MPKKFNCNFCDYHTSNKKDYEKHKLTSKHLKNENGNILEIAEIQKIPTLACDCAKQFVTYSGLWKHKQSCKNIKYNKENDEDYKEFETSDVKMLTNLVLEVVKQNQELICQNNKSQKQNQELQKHVIELCKTGTTNTTITNSNNNSNNKTFNLNVFLNEHCKDAMNIMDFVDSVKLQLSDLESLGRLGFVEGISNIILKNLKALDVHKRPVHCSDSKRSNVYQR
jgi:hypothetical protein